MQKIQTKKLIQQLDTAIFFLTLGQKNISWTAQKVFKRVYKK